MIKILVIEDDSFLQSLEASKLAKEGFEVLTASTGDEGMTKINEPGLGLVLLDLMLPNFDGFDILKKIREQKETEKIPVIVFSNLSEDSAMQKADSLGATKFMVKSNFTLDELVTEIKNILK
jgi:DNA-binding response OmpR family regulator